MVIVMKNLIHGVALNDADYIVSPTINGKQVKCPFYDKWKGMIDRCYNEKVKLKRPTYAECKVCDEWLTFSNFKSWMEKQDWHGNELDKDILIKGNKTYCPRTCVFISAIINTFIIDCGASKGDYPIGVSFHKGAGKFAAQCRNPFTKRKEYLGLFSCPNRAHEAWKKRKHELSCQLANTQKDERVANALIARYA